MGQLFVGKRQQLGIQPTAQARHGLYIYDHLIRWHAQAMVDLSKFYLVFDALGVGDESGGGFQALGSRWVGGSWGSPMV